MPRGTGRGSLEPPCPRGLPAEAGARGQHPGRGARNAPAGQTCLGGQGKGAPHGKGCFLDTGGVLLAQPTSALLSFSPHVFPAGTLKAAGAAPSSASSPLCPCSSARDSPSWPQGEPSWCRRVSRQHPARVPRWRAHTGTPTSLLPFPLQPQPRRAASSLLAPSTGPGSHRTATSSAPRQPPSSTSPPAWPPAPRSRRKPTASRRPSAPPPAPRRVPSPPRGAGRRAAG